MMNIKKQLAKLYTLDFLGSFNLTDSIWLLLLVSRGFSLWEAGLAEGIFHLVSFTFEVPSGMFADLYGRRMALCASWLVFAASSVLMLLSNNIAGVCLSFWLNAIGYNLASGTREALVFDSLKQAGEEERYISVSSWQNVIWRSSRAVSQLMAGAALLMGFKVCYLIHIAVSLCGACLSLTLTEADNGKDHSLNRISPRQVIADFAEQTAASIAFLRKTPMARTYMVSAAVITSSVTMVGFFLQQRINDIGGGGAVTLGPLLFTVSLGGIIGARLAARFYDMSIRRFFAIVGAAIAAGILGAGMPALPLCVAGGLFMNMFDEVLCTVTEAKLNHLFPSEQRATLVSVFSLCISFVMIVLSPLLGALCGLLGIGNAFAALAAALLCYLLFAAKRLT